MRTLRLVRLLPVLVLALALAGCGGGGGDSGGTAPDVPPGTDAGTVSSTIYDYVFAELNAMRAAENPNAAPFVRDGGLDTYAQAATDAFMTSGVAHGYFDAVDILPSCPTAVAPNVGATVPNDPIPGCPAAARENQGVASGGPTTAAVDLILNAFLAEKPLAPCSPGRGHYDAMIDPRMNSVGIGLTQSTDGRLWLTIEFCD